MNFLNKRDDEREALGLEQEVASAAIVIENGRPISVAVIDTYSLSREVLAQLLAHHLGEAVHVESFASAAECLEAPERFALTVLFSHGRNEAYFEAVREAAFPEAPRVLVVSDYSEADLGVSFEEAVELGACGLVCASQSNLKLLVAAVRFALSGGVFFPRELAFRPAGAGSAASAQERCPGLTRRQSDVFALLRKGKPNKIIAHELGMSESTVKVHIRDIMRSMGATNRTQAVFMAERQFAQAARA